MVRSTNEPNFKGDQKWIAPLNIDKNGKIKESIWNDRSVELLAAPWMKPRHPLSPTQEIRLSSQSQEWLKSKRHREK